MANYFELLGIPITNDEKIIKEARKKAIRNNPPEKDIEKYYEIQKILEVLLDSNKRLNYIAKINVSGDIDEIVKLAYEKLRNENYVEVKSLIEKLNGYEDEDIMFLKANLFCRLELYENSIEKYEQLMEIYDDENGSYENGKLVALIKLKGCDFAEEDLVNFIAKYKYISYACEEYIDFNIQRKEYRKNKVFIKLILFKFKDSLMVANKKKLEYFNLKNTIYQCDFINFNEKVEKLMNNLLEIEEKTSDFIIDELEYLSELLIDWEQPREYAIIQLNLDKYVRIDEKYKENLLWFINFCDEYEGAIKDGISEDFLLDVYLYINKFKLEKLEDKDIIISNAYDIEEKYIERNSRKVEEHIELLKNKYKLIYSFLYKEQEEDEKR